MTRSHQRPNQFITHCNKIKENERRARACIVENVRIIAESARKEYFAAHPKGKESDYKKALVKHTGLTLRMIQKYVQWGSRVHARVRARIPAGAPSLVLDNIARLPTERKQMRAIDVLVRKGEVALDTFVQNNKPMKAAKVVISLVRAEATITIIQGDAREHLLAFAEGHVACWVTSPPFWKATSDMLPGALGNEPTREEHVCALIDVFQQMRRASDARATMWLHYADKYNNGQMSGPFMGGDYREYRERRRTAGSKSGPLVKGLSGKQLLLLPERLLIAAQDDGWIVRSKIVRYTDNPVPTGYDRPVSAYDYVFLLTLKDTYHYDADAIREPGKRLASHHAHNVWTIASDRTKTHPTPFPLELARRCIRAGCPRDGLVLDPFMGGGTTAEAALREGRECVGIELNPRYVEITRQRIVALGGKIEIIGGDRAKKTG